MRNAEVIRQWKILKTIEAGRFTTAPEMAREHGVTERTIRRDIEALQEAGFPLYDDRSEGRKVWRLVEGYKQRLTQSFTLAELAALYFGKNLLTFLGGAPFSQDLESAFAKIREALPARSLPYLARIQELFSARPDPWKDYYLYARAHEYGEVRTFAVERIQSIEVLDHTFEIPPDFSVSEYARGAFGIAGGKAETVELVFGPEMAGYIRERVWHESQVLGDRPDGSVTLRLQVAPGWELKSWIKGFLPHVRVLQPPSLREEIGKDLDKAARNFPGPRKGSS